MKAPTAVNERCGIARSLTVLGEKWSLLVVRDVQLGVTRFTDIRERLGVAPDILSDRLAKLVELGVLERRGYREDGARARDEYVLTPAGAELAPVLSALQSWGDRNVPIDLDPVWRYVEAESGAPAHVGFIGPDGHEIDPSRIAVQRLPVTDAAR